MPALCQGDRISNYILEGRLGAGSFGEVWKARHHVFGDVVAIKVPTDAQYVRNLQHEGVVVHGLRHPNIVRAIDLDPYGDPPYLIMEYVDGPSLDRVIAHYRAAFPIPVAVRILQGILGALRASHEAGLIHRDVKPANILLNHPLEKLDSITEQSVKVTDFGLGRVFGVTTQSILQSGSVSSEDGKSISGTLAYMAPEQQEGKEADGRSDLYSCGVVFFEMLTGERPAGTDLPSSIRREVPANLDEIFRRSYTRLERRYASAKEMLDALTAESRPRTGPPPPPSPWTAPGEGSHCPACREPVEREDQFCIACGVQLAASVPKCSSCGAFVHTEDRFCIFCGNDLTVLKS